LRHIPDIQFVEGENETTLVRVATGYLRFERILQVRNFIQFRTVGKKGCFARLRKQNNEETTTTKTNNSEAGG
jgi:hypothetical protein